MSHPIYNFQPPRYQFPPLSDPGYNPTPSETRLKETTFKQLLGGPDLPPESVKYETEEPRPVRIAKVTLRDLDDHRISPRVVGLSREVRI